MARRIKDGACAVIRRLDADISKEVSYICAGFTYTVVQGDLATRVHFGGHRLGWVAVAHGRRGTTWPVALTDDLITPAATHNVTDRYLSESGAWMDADLLAGKRRFHGIDAALEKDNRVRSMSEEDRAILVHELNLYYAK